MIEIARSVRRKRKLLGFRLEKKLIFIQNMVKYLLKKRESMHCKIIGRLVTLVLE